MELVYKIIHINMYIYYSFSCLPGSFENIIIYRLDICVELIPELRPGSTAVFVIYWTTTICFKNNMFFNLSSSMYDLVIESLKIRR